MNRKWCTRCNRYHDSKPVDEKELIEKHSRDIAIEIDREVIESIKNIRAGDGSIRVSKNSKIQG